MPDKSPHHHNDKKPGGMTIKQKRAAKREKGHPVEDTDPIAHLKKRA